MKILRNESGAILLMACIGLFVVLMLAAGFALSLFSELANARRFQNATAAFWLAQAGISRFTQDMEMLEQSATMVIAEGDGRITLRRDDSSTAKRVITSTGEVGGSRRTIQIEFPAQFPEAFQNAVSTRGDIVINGKKCVVAFNDRMRLTGKFINKAKHSSIFTEDMATGITPGKVSVIYPDANNNGIPNEFNDFVAYNRQLVAAYPEDEVVTVEGNSTHVLTPEKSFKGKKIIYVEGDEGEGNVIIQFGGTWGKDQDITIISTGNVMFNQGGLMDKDSRLNIIAWSGYKETAVLPSSHYGIIYTHGEAHFDDIHDTSVTNGCVIADGGITIGEVWSTKTFNYADFRYDGRLPPGFKDLIGGCGLGYSSTPGGWKEI